MSTTTRALIAIVSVLATGGCSLSRNGEDDGVVVTTRKVGGAIEARFSVHGKTAITVENANVLALLPKEPGTRLRVTAGDQRIDMCGYLDFKTRSSEPSRTVIHGGDHFEATVRIEHIATWYCLAPGTYGVRIGHVQPGLEVWSEVVPIRVTAY